VLLLAESGLLIRNVLLGAFSSAVVAEAPLVGAVPDPDEPRLRAALDDRRVELVAYPRDVVARPANRRQKLTRFDMIMTRLKEGESPTRSKAVQARLWEPAHRWRGTLWARGLRAAGWALARTRLMGAVESVYLRRIDRRGVTRWWREVLSELRPSVVVSTKLTLATLYEASTDLPAVVAARSLGIPCGTLVQSWDNLSTKSAVIPPWLDRYWTWSGPMTEQLRRQYPRVPSDRIREVGSPHFDFHRRADLVHDRHSYMSAHGLDPSRPFVLLGTGTPKRLPNEPATVLALVEALADNGYQSMVRLHPKDPGDRWSAIGSRLGELGAAVVHTRPSSHMDLGGFVLPDDFFGDQLSAISHAVAVVNTSSTLTVDAAVLDRPVVCLAFEIGPHDERFPEGRAAAYGASTHFGPLLSTGGVDVVRSIDEFVEAIRAAAADPGARAEGRSRVVAQVVGVADGQAGARLAAEALALRSRGVARSKAAAHV
jgi:hypothetical protein